MRYRDNILLPDVQFETRNSSMSTTQPPAQAQFSSNMQPFYATRLVQPVQPIQQMPQRIPSQYARLRSPSTSSRRRSSSSSDTSVKSLKNFQKSLNDLFKGFINHKASNLAKKFNKTLKKY
jgi:hypothetical protein